MTKLGEMLAAQLTEHVDAISKTSEATIEQLMAALPMSGGMIIAATIQYGDETTTTEPKGSLTTHAADDDQP
jgi:ABC-type transport system involved in cytochrome c biogenesis ATPase subunit